MERRWIEKRNLLQQDFSICCPSFATCHPKIRCANTFLDFYQLLYCYRGKKLISSLMSWFVTFVQFTLQIRKANNTLEETIGSIPNCKPFRRREIELTKQIYHLIKNLQKVAKIASNLRSNYRGSPDKTDFGELKIPC